MIRALVVDDHAVVRHGVMHILSEELEGAVLGEAGSADEALRLVFQGHWDVVVLDITMPGRSGLEVLQDIKRERPNLPVLILSMHPEDQMATRVLKAGAAGYVTKDGNPVELIEAVRIVLRGGRYVSPTVAERLVLDLQEESRRLPHERLSDREYEVLCMIARGRTVTEVAETLGLSVKTVSTYRTRILEKLHMHNNAELIHYALQHKLVD